jgi:hypothetical protein
VKQDAIVLFALMFAASAAFGQVIPRKTPLGTQRPKPAETKPQTPAPEPAARPAPTARPREAAAAAVQRARAAHGGESAIREVKDSIAEGHLTYVRGAGSQAQQATFDMTLLLKGEAQVQRIVKQTGGEVRQGSNGTRTWNSFGGHAPPASGASLRFIESQTARSISNLLDYERRGGVLHEGGMKDNATVVEVQDRVGRKTSYSIDTATSMVTRLEFETGRARDMLSGNSVPVLESYVFSDFRTVKGVPTPFKIERYVQGTKLEEMRFTSIRHNASVPDSAFHP